MPTSFNQTYSQPLTVIGITPQMIVGGSGYGTLPPGMSAPGIVGPLALAQSDLQGRIEIDGTFQNMTFQLQASSNADSTSPPPVYGLVDFQTMYNAAGAVVQPYTVTNTPGLATLFFIPNLAFMNGVQIVITALNGGNANIRVRTGSFYGALSSSGGGSGQALTNLWLEMTRVRVALSDQQNTDYAAAISVSDLGKV